MYSYLTLLSRLKTANRVWARVRFLFTFAITTKRRFFAAGAAGATRGATAGRGASTETVGVSSFNIDSYG